MNVSCLLTLHEPCHHVTAFLLDLDCGCDDVLTECHVVGVVTDLGEEGLDAQVDGVTEANGGYALYPDRHQLSDCADALVGEYLRLEMLERQAKAEERMRPYVVV